MILQVVYFPVVSFLAVDLHWSVEFLVQFLGWNFVARCVSGVFETDGLWFGKGSWIGKWW